jgi:hypothetical protein
MTGHGMPPKLAPEVKKIAIIAPLGWLAKVQAWRRAQDDMPNVSEAIRRLVEMGLDAAKAKHRKGKSE